ncbi:MAG: hypothetical protein K0R29_975 [Pseudobdellovibrio sp.]|nr:hypothetical protein [Pseudobdellovibrio sp.]
MSSLSILQGHVYHSRSETAANSFRYPIFNIYFSVDETEKLQELFKRRYFRLLSFKPSDYLEKTGGNLKNEIEIFAAKRFQFHRGADYDRVYLQTIPKMFGYVFNPVSFWYFFKSEKLAAVMCEVNNTFGEKHYYWLNEPSANLNSQWMTAQKEFHVSPFFPIDGKYKFRFDINSDSVTAHINFIAADHSKRLITWIKGDLSELNQVSPVKLVLRYGWMTPLVVIRIHMQAVKLYFKKVKFFTKPELPENAVTYGNTNGDKK